MITKIKKESNRTFSKRRYIRQSSSGLSIFQGLDSSNGKTSWVFEFEGALYHEKTIIQKYVQILQEVESISQGKTLKVEDIFFNDDGFFIVHEVSPYKPLYDFIIEEENNYSSSDLAFLTLKLGQTLETFHSKNLFHFALSPEMVFWDGNRNVKIIGFGVHQIKEYLEISNNDNFFAPEVQEYLPGQGLAGDIYSLGTLLHFMHTKVAPEPMSNQMPAGALREVVNQCLAIDPAKRFPEVRFFLKEVEGYLDSIEEKTQVALDANTFKIQKEIPERQLPPPPVTPGQALEEREAETSQGLKVKEYKEEEETKTNFDASLMENPSDVIATDPSLDIGLEQDEIKSSKAKAFIGLFTTILLAVGAYFFLIGPQKSNPNKSLSPEEQKTAYQTFESLDFNSLEKLESIYSTHHYHPSIIAQVNPFYQKEKTIKFRLEKLKLIMREMSEGNTNKLKVHTKHYNLLHPPHKRISSLQKMIDDGKIQKYLLPSKTGDDSQGSSE